MLLLSPIMFLIKVEEMSINGAFINCMFVCGLITGNRKFGRSYTLIL